MSRAWHADNDGVTLHVRLTPKAGRDAIEGVREDGDRTVLLCKVTAAAQDGEANAALIRMLARIAGVAKSAVSIEAGHQARQKRLALRGDAGAIITAFEALELKR